MIENLTVENYRSFQNYSMNNLKRVNLLTGLNNSGKTSLLEAVEILASGGETTHFLQISARRREALREFDLDGQTIGVATHFFNGRTFEKPLIIDSNDWRVITRTLTPDDGAMGNDRGLVVEAKSQTIESAHIIPLDEEDGFASMRLRRQSGKFSRVEFVGTRDFDWLAIGDYWNEILVSQSEEMVVETLQLLDDRITSLAYLSKGKYRGKMYVGIRGETARTPIGGNGEGIQRFLALAIQLTLVKGGILLVDEIDTGLHYSVLADMWKLVIGTAIKNDIQVFATTHSLDCIRGLNEACERNPEYAAEISLQTIDRSLNSSIAGDSDDLKSAMSLGVEVR